MIQKWIGRVLLLCGIVFGAAIIRNALRYKEEIRSENGAPLLLGVIEAAIYFLATLGISDFLLNTLTVRQLHLTEDKKLPGTLVVNTLVPSAVIAFSLLQAESNLELKTLIPCACAITLGGLAGVRIVGGLSGPKIKRFMGFALIGSFAALVFRLIISRGAPGELYGLSSYKLVIAVLFSFAWGAINMLGVPMKPAATAVFLLLGLSPIATLTLVLVSGCIGPMGGGISILKTRLYHQRSACAAVICGSVGALLGCLFTISVNAVLLNVLIMIVMLIAIVSMLR